MLVEEPDLAFFGSFGNFHVTAFEWALGTFSCEEYFLKNFVGGKEWSGASSRGAEEGGGQSDLAGRHS